MQDGQQAGVGLRVLQLLVDQVKHLGSTLGVNVDLRVLGGHREWGEGRGRNRGRE